MPYTSNTNNTLLRTLALGLVLIGSPAAALASPLSEAVDSALQQHPDRELASREQDLGNALAQKANQLIADDPRFNLKYLTDGPATDQGYREWEGGVELPLWSPEQRSLLRREAGRTLDVAAAMQEAKRLEVTGQVRERLWQAAMARSHRDQAQVALNSSRELERDIQRRVEAGELAQRDMLLVQREVTEREDALQKAETALQQAQRQFMHYTGQHTIPAAEIETVPAGSEVPPAHPHMTLADRTLEKSRAYRDRVSKERRAGSSLWVGGTSSRPTAGMNYDSAVGVEVSIPLGTRSHFAPRLMEAERTLAQAQANRDRMYHELEESLHEALLQHELAADSVQRAERRNTLAGESLRLNRRAFDLGETDLIRLLTAQADALSAQHDLEMTRLQFGQASARLNQALGVIPQ